MQYTGNAEEFKNHISNFIHIEGDDEIEKILQTTIDLALRLADYLISLDIKNMKIFADISYEGNILFSLHSKTNDVHIYVSQEENMYQLLFANEFYGKISVLDETTLNLEKIGELLLSIFG